MADSVTSAELSPQILHQGVDGFVVRFSEVLTEPANRAALALRAALVGGAIPGVAEASSALASVYLRIDGDMGAAHAALARLVAEEDFGAAALPEGRRRFTVPAAFGGDAGPMLEQAAGQAGLEPEAAIDELTAVPLRVLAIGFAPGQPYLGELGDHWNIPRLGELIEVPESALVVAIRQIVLFANPSPTGWQWVGTTAFRCFRPDAERPFALAPGDELLFRRVDAAELAAIGEADRTGDGGATVERIV